MREDSTTRGGDHSLLAESDSTDEDFLYHLYRGSELLMQDRVVEAKEELERALELQPQDAKGQDLLAGVYFRLGVYPRAIEIWRRLVDAYPRDATLRVNLALALLKTGQPADALNHLHAGLQINPSHERAWGYLGLTFWRLGRFQEARDAFLRAGQAPMARRMEDVLGSSAGILTAPDEPDVDSARDRALMRSAAEQAIERFEAEALTVEPSSSTRITGSWWVAEPGEEHVPSLLRSVRKLPIGAPPKLGTLLDHWLVSLPEEVPLAIGPTGELFLYTRGNLYARIEGLRAVRGQVRTTPVQRRARGRELDEILGEREPIMLWRGPVSAVLRPPAGKKFFALHLDDDVFFVREELVWAFDDRLGFESGRLPVDKRNPLMMLQLFGTGSIVVCMSNSPAALNVSEEAEVHVVPEALVGWTGRLLPRGRGSGTEPYSVMAPPLSFRGEGVVVVA
jgi:hypothetical protein